MIPHRANGGEATWMDADGGGKARMNVEEVLTKPVHSPFGVQKIYTARGEAPSLWVGGLIDGWMDGRGKKVSFNFLYI